VPKNLEWEWYWLRSKIFPHSATEYAVELHLQLARHLIEALRTNYNVSLYSGKVRSLGRIMTETCLL
jgi:hypothetical protein